MSRVDSSDNGAMRISAPPVGAATAEEWDRAVNDLQRLQTSGYKVDLHLSAGDAYSLLRLAQLVSRLEEVPRFEREYARTLGGDVAERLGRTEALAAFCDAGWKAGPAQ